MKKIKGFTLVELLIVLFAVGVVCVLIPVVYTAVHFIAKFW